MEWWIQWNGTQWVVVQSAGDPGGLTDGPYASQAAAQKAINFITGEEQGGEEGEPLGAGGATFTSVPWRGASQPYPPGGKILNQSGIFGNLAKLANFPVDVVTGARIWNELPNYNEQFERDNNIAERWFRGPWGDRKRFIDYMLGYPDNVLGTANPNTSGTGLVRTIPHQHPEYPWLYALDTGKIVGEGNFANNPFVYALDSTGNPVPDPNNPGGFILNPIIAFYNDKDRSDANSCIVPIIYKALDYEIYDDATILNNSLTELNRYVEREETFAIQSLNVPGFYAKFVAGANPPLTTPTPAGLVNQSIPEGALQLLAPASEVVYRWHQVPDFPAAGVEACRGKINLNAFDPQITLANGLNVGGYNVTGYPPQTLLFLNAAKKRHRSATGRVIWEIEYRMMYHPQGWNNFPGSDGVTIFGFFGVGPPPYKTADFMDPVLGLFTQPNPAVNYQGAN